MIRQTILWHKKKGTPYAVKAALKPFTSKITLEENWQYGGMPYYFRLTVKGLRDFGDDGGTFWALIDDSKNVRSWLESINFDLSIEDPAIYYVGAADLDGGYEEILDANPENESGKIFFGNVELESGFEQIFFDETPESENLEVQIGFMQYEYGYDFVRDSTAEFDWTEEFPYWDGEIYDGESEIFPVDESFLRLYFNFDDNSTRYITLFNPREDITQADLKSLSSESSNLLMNRNGKLNKFGLSRARLFFNRVEKLF